MTENKKDDILVTLVKKAVGLPTQKSSCCGASAVAAIQPQAEGQGEKNAAPDTPSQAESEPCCSTADSADSGEDSVSSEVSGGCCG